MSKTCGLCGLPADRTSPYGEFFGGRAGDTDLHHDFDRVTVGQRDDGTPIKVTCYEAYTVYGLRADPGLLTTRVIALPSTAVEHIRALMAELRAESDELDCGA